MKQLRCHTEKSIVTAMPALPPVFGSETFEGSPTSRGPLFPVLTSNVNRVNVEFDSGVDLTQEVKSRISRYVEDTTRNNSIPFSTPQKTLTITLAEDGLQDAVVSFGKSSNSGLLEADRPLEIDKGQGSGKTAIDIFTDVQLNKDDSDIAKRLRSSFSENNQNSPSNPFVSVATANLLDESRLTFGAVLFGASGQYSPRKFPIDSGNPAAGSSVTIEDLSKIGSIVTTEAQGPFAEINYRQSRENLDVEARLKLLGQSHTSFGNKVSTGRFLGKSLVRHLKPQTENTVSSTVFEPVVESFGSEYNEYNTFTKASSLPSVAATAALLLVVGGFLYALARALKPSTPEIVQPVNKGQRSSFYGSFSGNANANQTLNQVIGNSGRKLFDWPETSHDFGSCLTAGIETFFGDSGFVTTTLKIAGSNAYFRTILRSILRSLVELGVDVGASAGRLEANPLSVLTELDPLAIYDRLNSNKAVRFIGAMLSLGDRVLFSRAENPLDADGFSAIDSIVETISLEIIGSADGRTEEVINPAVLVSKSRLNNDKLAYSTNSVRSLILEPKILEKANRSVGTSQNYTNLVSKLENTGIVVAAGRSFGVRPGRISADIVKRTENYLDAQYVPFYFHDLRTNEIVTFHAFLENLSDQLSVEFNDTAGRIGGVKTYKDTKRTISFSFKVLAANEDDFESMWYKINRIGAMCYPQWTEGRKVSIGENTKFIQPFSQMPGASPMIRLRVGDVIKGNYSKLSASRLFGSGDPETNLTSNAQAAEAFQNEERRSRAADDIRRRYASGNFQDGDVVVIRTPPTNAPYLRLGSRDRAAGLSHHGEMRATVFRVQPGELVVQNVRTNTEPPMSIEVTAAARSRRSRRARTVSPTPDAPTTINETTQFVIPLASIVRNGSNVESIVNAQAAQIAPATNSQQTESSSDSTKEFFEDSESAKNPIMRAFSSAQGKGLAGFLTSFDLSNLMEAPWITEKIGDRAPMLLTVGTSFSPIHDIQPGLDHNGVLTAPIWPVGGTMGMFMDNDTGAKTIMDTAKRSFKIPVLG
jgi:hypothetical protein